ncbi:MAG: 30S ribosome-binding factor RbfA [Acidobacteriota bacterium]
MRTFALRRERLVEAIRETLSQLLLAETKDPRLAGVIISAVELSGDLKLARAFFSVIGDAERERQVADGLRQASGFLRHEMGLRLRMHSAPALEFLRDKGFERAERVQRILDEISATRGPADLSPEGESQTPGAKPREQRDEADG